MLEDRDMDEQKERIRAKLLKKQKDVEQQKVNKLKKLGVFTKKFTEDHWVDRSYKKLDELVNDFLVENLDIDLVSMHPLNEGEDHFRKVCYELHFLGVFKRKDK